MAPDGELDVGWNGTGIKAKGIAVFFVLAVLAVIASNLYGGWRIEQAVTRAFEQSTHEHLSLKTSQDRTSCIVSMTPEQRERFRVTYSRGAFVQACPWLEEP